MPFRQVSPECNLSCYTKSISFTRGILRRISRVNPFGILVLHSYRETFRHLLLHPARTTRGILLLKEMLPLLDFARSPSGPSLARSGTECLLESAVEARARRQHCICPTNARHVLRYILCQFASASVYCFLIKLLYH
jgi:hypothetical protein